MSHSFERPDQTLINHFETPLTREEEEVDALYTKKYADALPDREVVRVVDKERDIVKVIKPALEYTAEDAAYLKSKEAEFKDQTEKGILLEKILLAQNKWWGDNAEVYRASRYDDVANGVDLIVDFLNDENERLGLLAIDVTMGNEVTLAEKQRKIEEKLETGKMNTLRYGPTEDGEISGTQYELQTYVPRINLTLDSSILERLSKVLVEEGGAQMPYHPVGDLIIEEALGQLRRHIITVEAYAHLSPSQKEVVIGRMSTIVEILTKIKEEKLARENEKPQTKSEVWNDPMANRLIQG